MTIIEQVIKEKTRIKALGYKPVVVRMSEVTHSLAIDEWHHTLIEDASVLDKQIACLDVSFDRFLPLYAFRILCEFESAPKIDLEEQHV